MSVQTQTFCLNCGIEFLWQPGVSNYRRVTLRTLLKTDITVAEALSVLYDDLKKSCPFVTMMNNKIYVCNKCNSQLQKVIMSRKQMVEAAAAFHDRTVDSSLLKRATIQENLVSTVKLTRSHNASETSMVPKTVVKAQETTIKTEPGVQPRGGLLATLLQGRKRDISSVTSEELGDSKTRRISLSDPPQPTGPFDPPQPTGLLDPAQLQGADDPTRPTGANDGPQPTLSSDYIRPTSPDGPSQPTDQASVPSRPSQSEDQGPAAFHRKLLAYLAQHKYSLAVLSLLKKNKTSMRRGSECITKCFRQELNHHILTAKETCAALTRKNLETFSWKKIVNEADQTMPTLVQMLRRLLSRDKYSHASDAKVGPVLCMILFIRSKKHNLFQAINSVQLWRSGCEEQLHGAFYNLGWCCNHTVTNRNIAQIRKNNRDEVDGWKMRIEEELKADLLGNEKSRVQNGDSCESEDPSEKKGSDKKDPGFTLCWDVLEKDVKHQKLQGNFDMTKWVIPYAVRNRISFRRFDHSVKCARAASIPLKVFLPTGTDIIQQKRRMKLIVQRLIQRYIPYFRKHFKSCITHHISHAHSEEMKAKSDVVSLGVHEADLSSVAGTVSVMEYLHRFVPDQPDGESLYAIPCHGDSLSMEWMLDATQESVTGKTMREKLQGLVPVPQEFDKNMVLLQDLMDQLYRTSSSDERGTLYHARNIWDWWGVEETVSQPSSHAPDFMRFIASGLTCILALKLRGMKSLSDKPKGGGELHQKQAYLNQLASEVVDFIWLHPSKKDVDDLLSVAEDGSGFQYCVCREETDEGMVECSNPVCLRGQWFHPSCLKIKPPTEEDELWWCCKACQQICETTEPPPVRDDGQRAQDHVQNYTRTLLWGALSDMARRDAVKEGDGPAMMSYWRSDMLNFWKEYNFQYLNLGHRFLAGLNGWLPKRVAFELLWNRTASPTGGQGNNIEIDLLSDLLTRQFKENLNFRNSTEMQIRSASHLIGLMHSNMDKIYADEAPRRRRGNTGPSRPHFQDSDVKSLIQEYIKDDLFGFTPGREHQSFPGFPVHNQIPRGSKLKDALISYSLKLDDESDLLSG